MENLGTEVPWGPSLPSAPADETGVAPGCWKGRGKPKSNFFVMSDLSPPIRTWKRLLEFLLGACAMLKPPQQYLCLKYFQSIKIQLHDLSRTACLSRHISTVHIWLFQTHRYWQIRQSLWYISWVKRDYGLLFLLCNPLILSLKSSLFSSSG